MAAPALPRTCLILGVLIAVVTNVNSAELQPLSGRTCPELPDVGTISNFTVVRIGPSLLTSLDVKIPWTVPTISKASVRMVQCFAGGACKHFYTMRFNVGVCGLMVDKNVFWSPVFRSVQPPMRCPLGQIKYEIRNASIGVDQFLVLFNKAGSNAQREAIWNVKIRVFDDRAREFLCADTKFKYS